MTYLQDFTLQSATHVRLNQQSSLVQIISLFLFQGEVTIRYFEIVVSDDGEVKLYDLFLFNSQTSQKSMCFMPKRGLDFMDCEIMRSYKLLNSSPMVEPVSFFVPRRVRKT